MKAIDRNYIHAIGWKCLLLNAKTTSKTSIND